MSAKSVKRTKNRDGYCPFKRQKSKADDTDGQRGPELTPESKQSKQCSKREYVRKGLFTPLNGLPQDGAVTMAIQGVSVNKTNTPSEIPAYVNGHSSCSSSNFVDYTRTKCHATSYGNAKPYGSGVSKGRHSSQQTCLRSAGANDGIFQIKCGVIRPSVPMNLDDGQHTGAIGGTIIDCKKVPGISQYGNSVQAHELDSPDQAPCLTSSRHSRASNHSVRSDLETDDLDMDIIVPIAVQIKERKSEEMPDCVPPAYARVPLQKSAGTPGFFTRLVETRNETSAIFILHHQATDDPELGDRFGASIETFSKRKDGYYRHVINQVDVNGVADRMKIRDGDELVLINDKFVPELDHKAVIKLFRDVPVDSHTRLSLVLRRPLIDGKWEWVSTSAILVPELSDEPRVRDLQFSKETGPSKTWSHWYRIQIPGTQMYLIISDGEVRAEVAKLENLKKYNICVMNKCVFDGSTGHYSYFACVFGTDHVNRNQNSYVCAKANGEICLNKDPQWFGFGRKGREMFFKVKDLNKYIACQISGYATCGKLCVEKEEFLFDGNSIEGSYDHPDTEFDGLSEPSSLRSSLTSSGSGSFRSFSQPNSEPLSLGLSDASVSSMESSSSGSGKDSGCYRHSRSGRSSGSGQMTFEEPLSDSGSEFLSYGSNYLSCGTPNTPMANLNPFSS